jgi:excisionase family DNA binding protein
MTATHVLPSPKIGVLLTRKEAAERLGMSVDTLDSERSLGHLAYIQRKAGGKVWISESAITEYLEKATHPIKPAALLDRPTYRKRRA